MLMPILYMMDSTLNLYAYDKELLKFKDPPIKREFLHRCYIYFFKIGMMRVYKIITIAICNS